MSRVFVLAAWNKSKAALDRVNGRGIVLGTVAGALISAVIVGVHSLWRYDGLYGHVIGFWAVFGAVCSLIGAVGGTIYLQAMYADKLAESGSSDAAKLAAKLSTVYPLAGVAGVFLVYGVVFSPEPVLGAVLSISFVVGGLVAMRNVRF